MTDTECIILAIVLPFVMALIGVIIYFGSEYILSKNFKRIVNGSLKTKK